MACDLTLGYQVPYADSVGGVAAIYFANWGDVTASYDTTGNTDEIIDLGAATFYKYETRTGGSFTDAAAKSADNGTVFNTQTINAMVKKLNADQTRELKLMSRGRPIVVVEDRNGNAWICGLDVGCDVNWEAQSGTARGDMNGYSLTITGETKDPAAYLQGSVAGDPFAGLNTSPTVVTGTNE